MADLKPTNSSGNKTDEESTSSTKKFGINKNVKTEENSNFFSLTKKQKTVALIVGSIIVLLILIGIGFALFNSFTQSSKDSELTDGGSSSSADSNQFSSEVRKQVGTVFDAAGTYNKACSFGNQKFEVCNLEINLDGKLILSSGETKLAEGQLEKIENSQRDFNIVWSFPTEFSAENFIKDVTTVKYSKLEIFREGSTIRVTTGEGIEFTFNPQQV